MAEVIDVFDSNRFKAVTLSGHYSKKPHVPGRIGELGIFVSDGMRTRKMTISSRAGKVSLIPATELGAPEPVHLNNKSKALEFEAVHLPLRGTIKPGEIQDVLSLRSEGDQLTTAQDVIDEKLMEMGTYHDATLEYQRLGALKGQLLDSDGSTVLLNLFTEFGLSAPTAFSLILGTSTTPVQKKCQELYRLVRDGLGGTPFRGIHTLVGDSFFDKLITHPEVRAAYANWSTNAQMRGNFVAQGFDPRLYDTIDFQRGRTRPHTVLDFSVGADLLRKERTSVNVQFDVRNLTKQLFLYNFESVFSGTHVGFPRLFSGRIGVRFK